MTPVELRQRRIALRLKQIAVAAEMGVSVQAVSSWETGARRPKDRHYQRLVALLQQDSATAE